MKYIDTHAHLNLPEFTADTEAVIKRCGEEAVTVINIGTKAATSKKAVDLAIAYENCYAMVGLHPVQAALADSDTFETESEENTNATGGGIFVKANYRDLAAQSAKVIGIGECGFDYYHSPLTSYAKQEAAFIAQIELANELNLPLMIHTRGPKPGLASPTGRSVYDDVYEVLKTYAKVPFNVHFWAGTYVEAKRFFSLGGTISFTGVVTFAKAYEEIIRAAPLDLIHAETDCPYVAPVPYRGQRAEPWMVKEVYRTIAQIRNQDEEVVRAQLVANALSLYKTLQL